MLPRRLLVGGGQVLGREGWTRADLLIRDGRIAAIGSDAAVPGVPRLDVSPCRVAPGFVDLHVHGGDGAMCEDAHPDGPLRISAALARHGVTGFLATVAALPPDELRAAVANLAAACGREPGARILGIHLEGPWLNPVRAGAQPRAALRSPSLAEFDELQAVAGGRIRWVTLAPELTGALDFIAQLRARGVTVALGHSDASALQFGAAVAAGASHVTHLFNALRPLHQREPGPIGAALVDDRVSVELICDGHHLDPQVIEIALRCKPDDRLALVSDAVAALGAADGPFDLFGVRCVIRDGSVRLAANGTLAGSCLGLDRAVRNLHRWFPSMPVERWLRAASTVPAGLLAESDIGVLAPGCRADLVVLDLDGQVVATLVGGEVVHYGRPASPSASCELCRLARTTRWHAEFEQPFRFAILDCDSCDVAMAVFGDHRAVPTREQRAVMQAELATVADALYPGGWFFDDHMRQIPDHYHCHARPFPKGFKMP